MHSRLAPLSSGLLAIVLLGALTGRSEAQPRSQLVRTPGGRLTVERFDRTIPRRVQRPPGADRATFYGIKLRTPGLFFSGTLGFGVVKVRHQGKTQWRLALTRGLTRASKKAYRGGADPGWVLTTGAIKVGAEPLSIREGARTPGDAIRRDRRTVQDLELGMAFGFSQIQDRAGNDLGEEGNTIGIGGLGVASGIEKTRIHSIALTRAK